MSTFDESKIRRDGEGKFASKGPAAEAGVQIAPVTGMRQGPLSPAEHLESARQAMAPRPGADPNTERDYRYFVASGAVPALTSAEQERWGKAMSDPFEDPSRAHAEAMSQSQLQLNRRDPMVTEIARQNVREALAYLSTEHDPSDPRIDAAVATICPHLGDAERQEHWDQVTAAGEEYRRLRDEPILTVESHEAHEAYSDAIHDMLEGHPAWPQRPQTMSA